MDLGGRVTTARGLLDAWRGQEGLRYTQDDLARFYASTYLTRNPGLDVDDTPSKAALLLEACGRAGVARPARLLEVGSGGGELLVRMARGLEAGEAVGADYSESIAAVARARTGFRVVSFDGARLPFADAEFDLVYFADVLEHVLEPVAWLREVARVGRRVAMLVPVEAGLLANAVYTFRRARGRMTNLEHYGHIWRFRRAQVIAMAAEAGLAVDAEVVHHAPSHPEGRNWKGRAMEVLRGTSARVLPRAAEAVFGSVTYVAVATRRS